MQTLTGTTLGADIWLRKVLPMGGGIGGGSSDAATTLLALNHLWQTGCSEDQLAQLGLALGADVPYSSAATRPSPRVWARNLLR